MGNEVHGDQLVKYFQKKKNYIINVLGVLIVFKNEEYLMALGFGS